MLVVNKVYASYFDNCEESLLAYEKLYDEMLAAIMIFMMLPCPYSVFIDTSLSNYVVITLEFGFRLRTSEV